MIDANGAILAFVGYLNQSRVDWMMVGSYSSNLHGVPRSTQDVDILVRDCESVVAGIGGQLSGHLEPIGQPALEKAAGKCNRAFNVRESQFRIELFSLTSDTHDQSRFARRMKVDFEGQEVFVATAEDVIITKLRWSKLGRRAKDVDDVLKVMATQMDRLDWGYVRHWCEQHGTWGLAEQIRSSITPR